MITQLLANGLVASCGYAMIALGFGLIYGTTRIFHIAHGSTYVVAAYAFYALHVLWQVATIPAAACALLLAAALGVAMEEVVYRPLRRRGATLLVFLLTSLGLYIFIVNLTALIFGSENKTLTAGLQQSRAIVGVIITDIQLAIVGSFLAVCAMLLMLRVTRIGNLVRALRDDEHLLAAIGKNPQAVRRIVFALGSAVSALAAILLGIDVGIDPQIGLRAVLIGAVAVIVGGMAHFEGALVGALVLGLLETAMVWQFSAQWSSAATFVTLIVFLVFCPEGLLGVRRRAEENVR